MPGRGPRRLVLFFALSVLLPALALAFLAFRSVEKEKRALLAERRSDLQRAAWLIRSELSRTLEELRAAEEERPWYQYNPVFFDPFAMGSWVTYVQSPISQTPPNPLVQAYFNTDPEGELVSPNAPSPRAPQQQASQAKEEVQTLRTQIGLDNAGRNLGPQLRELRDRPAAQTKGRFKEIYEENRRERLSRQGVAANILTRQRLKQIYEGMVEQAELQARADPEDVVEVDVSPFVFRSDPKEGILAYRYVDVPDDSGTWGDRPFVRLMQGFTLDLEHIEGTLFPDLVARYLDVPGGRAALVSEGGTAPDGEVVFEDELGLLPTYRVVLTDADEGWVDRRVSRLSLVFLAVAGGLFLVILGGLAFTVRTVRAELGLARKKSDFVAAVTHELRTPLTGIKMYADLLEAGWVKDEATRGEYVGFMAREADRLARLVNRVLDFARTDKGARRVEPLDLAVPILEVEKSFGPHLAERGFTLEVAVEDRRKVLADPDAVKQIILNLLENAAKYARDAEDRTIHVRVEAHGETALRVADHGPGVPEAERERVFTEFYRPGEELTRESSGAGIGLALVRRLAEAMGGSAVARETPGGGATFLVSLRAAPDPDTP